MIINLGPEISSFHLAMCHGSALRAPTISQIVLQMKAYITKQFGESIWQKGFYDRIIRNDEEYSLIWDYIDANPINWQDDTQYGST